MGPPLACNAIKLVDVPQKECYAKNGKGEVRLGVNDFRRLLKVSSKSIEQLELMHASCLLRKRLKRLRLKKSSL